MVVQHVAGKDTFKATIDGDKLASHGHFLKTTVH